MRSSVRPQAKHKATSYRVGPPEKLLFDLYGHFQDQMPYGTQKARDGDPDEFIYDALEDLGLPLGN